MPRKEKEVVEDSTGALLLVPNQQSFPGYIDVVEALLHLVDETVKREEEESAFAFEVNVRVISSKVTLPVILE